MTRRCGAKVKRDRVEAGEGEPERGQLDQLRVRQCNVQQGASGTFRETNKHGHELELANCVKEKVQRARQVSAM